MATGQDPDLAIADHRYVFVSGMPRSGTTPLARLIASHPKVSGLTNTGRPYDEGDYLQTVYPREAELGGPARFGLNPRAHLTEADAAGPAAGEKLFAAWSPYWDLTRPVLLQKTPSDIVRTRFLQAAFPNASFVFISRHPIVYALAVLKWNYRVWLPTLVKNWLACHSTLRQDLPHLKNALVLRYDDLSREPARACAAIEALLGLEPGLDASLVQSGLDRGYFESWIARSFRDGPETVRNLLKRAWSEAEVQLIERTYEHAINGFGYSFFNLL